MKEISFHERIQDVINAKSDQELYTIIAREAPMIKRLNPTEFITGNKWSGIAGHGRGKKGKRGENKNMVKISDYERVTPRP